MTTTPDPDPAVAALDDDEDPDNSCGDFLALDPVDDDVDDELAEAELALDDEAAPPDAVWVGPHAPDGQAVELDDEGVRTDLTPDAGLEDGAPAEGEAPNA